MERILKEIIDRNTEGNYLITTEDKEQIVSEILDAVGRSEQLPNCGYTVLATVPYQLCPKCNGDGTVMVQNWNGSTTSISSGLQTCNLCGGAMIIPMHIIPTEYKIQLPCEHDYQPDITCGVDITCCTKCGDVI